MLLFTKKKDISPAIKALSAEFRDTLRISVISIPDADKATGFNKELLQDYEVKKLPRLVLEQTYDPNADQKLEQYLIHEFKGDAFQL